MRHSRAALTAFPLLAAAHNAHAAPPAQSFPEAVPPPVARNALAPAGAPEPGATLHLSISLPFRNQAALNALVQNVANPASPAFRHYLSVQDFTARFGPTAQDHAAVVAYLQAQGLTVTHTARNRALIGVDARVTDVERVFHVQMRTYRHPTENRLFFAPDRAPTLAAPATVLDIVGLSDFVRPTRKFVQDAQSAAPRTGSGPGGQFTGNDIRRAYYPTGALTGAGQTVGLMELEGLNVSDVNLYFSNGYGPANTVPIQLIATDTLPVTCDAACADNTEQALDVEYLISVAPGLANVQVYVGNTAEDVLNAMASDNTSTVLSTSWGWQKVFNTDNQLFKEFAVQGQSNLTASGDYSSLQASGAWPEEARGITAVGGTNLMMFGAGARYYGETGWIHSAGGASLDPRILIEPYQSPYVTAANKGSSVRRNVPDVAASANSNMVVCANGSCGGGFGGTSFASPIWAGFLALANEYAATQGKPQVGFINPAIYALGQTSAYATTFHDQTHGRSGRYTCTPSYDLVTGLGSPKGQALIQALVP